MEAIKELECENFEVFKMAQLSPTERYILKPKNKTEDELQNLFGEAENYTGTFPFIQYKGVYLVERTFEDAINGVKVRDLVNKRKIELL
jgi:hypothetical protein